MKSLFAGYYRPTKEEFDELWQNCTFVFDASVLLDLYRSTAKTRDVLLSILEKIKDRIWLPYQAAWEYQENRLDVIAKERELYAELQETLGSLMKSIQQKMHNHAVESADKIKEELEGASKKVVSIIDQEASDHPDLMTSDHIREKITALFDGRVGKKLDDKRLAGIYQDGPKRYEQKIPPGYKDAEKGGTRQFGDLVIWNEVLEQAKTSKRPVVFITSDTKEDWSWKRGQFTIGPRPELVQEMAVFANAKFYMYNVERFLSEAQKRFDTKVESTEVKKAAEEFKDIESKRSTVAQELVEAWAHFEKQKSLTPHKNMQDDKELSDVRFLRRWRLSSRPASEAGSMSTEEWVQAIEALTEQTVTSEQAEVLEGLIKAGLITALADGEKNLEGVCKLLSKYLALWQEAASQLKRP